MNNSLHGNKRKIIKLEDDGGGMREIHTEYDTDRETWHSSTASNTSGGHVWLPVLMMGFLNTTIIKTVSLR